MQNWFRLALLTGGLLFAPLTPPAWGQSQPIALAPGVVDTPLKLGQGEWAVDGMLTMPAGPGPHSAVVLVPGSGPGSMDLNVGGSTIFRDLAWGLAARGVAVIRFNKRPTQHAAAFKALDRKPSLEEEYIDDASSAIAYLRTVAGVDPKRVFVFGNSMGATLAATIANRNNSPGAIIMAGSPRRVGDVLIEQATYGLSIAKDEKERMRAEEVIANGKRINAITAESDPEEIIHGSPVKVWRELAAPAGEPGSRAIEAWRTGVHPSRQPRLSDFSGRLAGLATGGKLVRSHDAPVSRAQPHHAGGRRQNDLRGVSLDAPSLQ